MKSPLISVVMSVYNQEDTLNKSIHSVLEQSYENVELIIINDGSTDTTEKILKTFSSDSRISVYYHKNRGLTASLNRGLRHATGYYVARIDADDFYYKDILRDEVDFLENHPAYVAVCCGVHILDENNHLVKEIFPPENECLTSWNLLFGNVFPHTGTMYKMETLQSIGLYDEKFLFTQDYDLLTRISKHGKIKAIQTNGYYSYNGLGAGRVSISNFAMQQKYRHEISLREINALIKPDDISYDDLLVLLKFIYRPWLLNKEEIKPTYQTLRQIHKHFVKAHKKDYKKKKLDRVMQDHAKAFLMPGQGGRSTQIARIRQAMKLKPSLTMSKAFLANFFYLTTGYKL